MNKIPVLIIHGSLGSGKTTFLKHLLGNAAVSKPFIIENEFATTSVDSSTILESDHDASITAISGGCICCSSGEELFTILDKLAHDNWQNYVIIETTGVAESAQLIKSLYLSESFIRNYEVKQNIFIVDAAAQNLSEFKSNHEIDVKLADLAVIGKTDLVENSKVNQLKDLLQEMNKEIKISSHNKLGYTDLPDVSKFESSLEKNFISLISKIPALKGIPEDLTYKILNLTTYPSIEVFSSKLAELYKEESMQVMRVKGFIKAGSNIYHIESTKYNFDYEPSNQKLNELVVIGKKLVTSKIMDLLQHE